MAPSPHQSADRLPRPREHPRGPSRGLPRGRSAGSALLLVLAACASTAEPPQAEADLTPRELMELLAGRTASLDGVEWEDELAVEAGSMDPVEARAFARFERELMEGHAWPGPRQEGEPVPPVEGGSEPAQDPAAGEETPAGEGEEPAAEEPEQELDPISLFSENPYLAFGRRIMVYPDGTITKPYPMRVGTGQKMLDLIQRYGNFPMWDPATMGDGPSPPNLIKLELEDKWDVELVQDLRNVAAKGAPIELADWLLVTAGEELLHEVEEFINLFAAGVPQIEIEAKIVEITFTESLDIGITQQGDTPIFDFPGDGTFFKTLGYNFPSQAGSGNAALLAFGAVQDGLAFNAVLEALSTRDNVSIISQPRIAVREGGRASIHNTLKIPFLEVKSVTQTGGFTTQLTYVELGVQLYVVPRVIGTETVALDVDIEASQQSGNALTVDSLGGTISTPVISTRAARTTVYLQPGQAVIIGGLITERSVEAVRKVPLLGSIPLLKHLFRSSYTSTEQSNVLFFISPRILQGTDFSREF